MHWSCFNTTERKSVQFKVKSLSSTHLPLLRVLSACAQCDCWDCWKYSQHVPSMTAESAKCFAETAVRLLSWIFDAFIRQISCWAETSALSSLRSSAVLRLRQSQHFIRSQLRSTPTSISVVYFKFPLRGSVSNFAWQNLLSGN